MSKNHWVIVLIAVAVMAGLLYAIATDSDSLVSEDQVSGGGENTLLKADAPDTERVVGLEPTGRKKERAHPGGPLPKPIDLDRLMEIVGEYIVGY